jgi:hypothetical protein
MKSWKMDFKLSAALLTTTKPAQLFGKGKAKLRK